MSKAPPGPSLGGHSWLGTAILGHVSHALRELNGDCSIKGALQPRA